MDQKTIDNNFKYHAPTGTQPVKYEAVRDYGKLFAEHVNSLCPDGREKSIALTKIEEAVMWANASIARNG